TARGVTLMPPGVYPEPPPTNMRAPLSSIVVDGDSWGSTTANPPERIIAEENTAIASIRHDGSPATVSGLANSKAAHAIAPAISSTVVVIRVRFVWSVHLYRVHRARIRLRKTGKPKLPTNTPIVSGARMNALSSNTARPPEWTVKPAFPNAEIA